MKLSRFLAAMLAVASAGVLAQTPAPAPFVVTSTADPTGAPGTVTLREAINTANLSCISVPTNPTITFSIPGTPPAVIKPVTSLPVLNCPMTIDGGGTPNTQFV